MVSWRKYSQQELRLGVTSGPNMSVALLNTSLPYLALNAIRLHNNSITWKFTAIEILAMSGTECA